MSQLIDTTPLPPITALHPDGGHLTSADLPPPETTRWTAMRKAVVVAAINQGVISLEKAVATYPGTSEEELRDWIEHYKSAGVPGLALIKHIKARPGQQHHYVGGRRVATPSA